ncbi:ATP-binding protein [Paenibacillus thalictri]|uniref:ATP-binding protein n=1 Tax=Paenibacillus thalictri TaxID=2527873 RepID=UPI0013EF01C2|nr:ATP-binding protein [Paenibacillus thalictri]
MAPTLAEWQRFKQAIDDFCRNRQWNEPLMLDLQLVCEEWFLNIVKHGYRVDRPDALAGYPPIEVAMWMEGQDELNIRFVDAAPPFDPVAYEAPNLALSAEERQIGGLGIYLIKQKMDNCEYRRIDGRNELILRKNITQAI